MSDDIEIEFEDTRKGIKLKLKGKPEWVQDYIERYGYENAMKEAVNRTAPQTDSTEEKPKMNVNEVPEKPKATTLTEYIKALMYSKWGKEGRTYSELLEVAKMHGISMTASSLSGILHGLANIGKLRRLKEAGEQWKYYPPISVAMEL